MPDPAHVKPGFPDAFWLWSVGPQDANKNVQDAKYIMDVVFWFGLWKPW